jgi:hypothetical protein
LGLHGSRGTASTALFVSTRIGHSHSRHEATKPVGTSDTKLQTHTNRPQANAQHGLRIRHTAATAAPHSPRFDLDQVLCAAL